MTIMMVYYYIQNICGHSYYMTLHDTIFFITTTCRSVNVSLNIAKNLTS